MSQHHPSASSSRGAPVGAAGGGAILVTILLLATLGAVSLAACGGSSNGAAPASPSASSPTASTSTPQPSGASPLPGTPEQAVAAFWKMVDADDFAGIAAASAPGAVAITAAADDIERAKLLRVAWVQQTTAGAQVQVDVHIVPSGEVTPWGEAGPHTLFVDLIEAPGGGWLVAGWGTGP